MRKRTSAADPAPNVGINIVIVTMDPHLASAAERARTALRQEYPGLRLSLHAAAEWGEDGAALASCRDDIARADIVVATMLFMEDHLKLVLPALRERRAHCDAMVCAMSAAEIVKLTRLGGLDMSVEATGALALLKRLRGSRGKPTTESAGLRQMKLLRRIPRLLRFIPGTAQDVRNYFLTLQYWLGGSERNVVNMVRLLVSRYASGPRLPLRSRSQAAPPEEYPEVGVYHPKMRGRISASASRLPAANSRQPAVGLLLLRSYVLAGNTAHYDGVIAALEAKGLRVIPVFASGLDARPAVEKFFLGGEQPRIDAFVSLTGFSLVGGPAYNDSEAAQRMLGKLDVPYLAAHPVEFQTREQWQNSERGLLPLESTIMVAIPELDGASCPTVFGGRGQGRDMEPIPERAVTLAARTAKLVRLRRSARAERRLAIVLFNFPPHAGNTGTAAHLAVFESLYRTLESLHSRGYHVELPPNVDALRESLIGGNAARYGATCNVHARVAVEDHVRRERHLREIETQWGAAPGRLQTDGRSLFIYGERFGNVFVGVQPGFGYEGDPMRLLFARGFTPTHAFSAFYRWIREDFAADIVLHFGTHGALEFMPGKQTGLGAECWPERLIGDLPNVYLYASNNPSEGTIAKRRAAATLVSYLTPAVTQAGLYRGLTELKASIERWRSLEPDADDERRSLAPLIQTQATAVDLAPASPIWSETQATEAIAALSAQMLELEYTLIPHGLHILGEPPSHEARLEMLAATAQASDSPPPPACIEAIAAGRGAHDAAAVAGGELDAAALKLLTELERTNRLLQENTEIAALLHALDGRFIAAGPGGDVLRTPQVLPTGRNIHGFDPFRVPSSWAMRDGARQTELLLERHCANGKEFPECVAIVLWGTDNLKNDGAPLAQVLALLGARARFDGFGRLTGATLIPLDQLGRPRIDVIVTVSGIFRDLLPLQVKLLAEAAFLAATADEPCERNFVRKHALQYQAQHGCDLETAALRVFSNAEGTYGANVNHLVESSAWSDEDELAETYTRRKSFAYGRSGRPAAQAPLLQSILAAVELTYQNLDSVELGVTTIDNYFDTLGGISRAVRRARGDVYTPIYVGDQTCGKATVRTLAEQVALETRTRILNPKWYEGLLEHGYEGVRQIEAHVTNTMGWSATTGQVAPWVYQQITRTFVLDKPLRERMAALNPIASARVANRLIEAHERKYWQPDPAMLDALRRAGEELEDRIEGLQHGVAA